MNMLVLAFVLTFSCAFAVDVFDLKAAPWWEVLKEEKNYKQCKSSCTEFSSGTRTAVELCDDAEVCRGRKVTVDEFASKKCSEWKSEGDVPGIHIQAEGHRFKQDPSLGAWLSCAIFCRTGHNQWYSPRKELGREAFFPDGTWCHRDRRENKDYYCQKNLCLPKDYEFSNAVRLAEEALANEDEFDGFFTDVHEDHNDHNDLDDHDDFDEHDDHNEHQITEP